MYIKVKEHKLNIDGKEYTFRLDFKALIKMQEKYDDGLAIFNRFLASIKDNKDDYNLLLKILSCACTEEITEEELQNKLAFNFNVMKQLDAITLDLITNSLEITDVSENENENTKNNIEEDKKKE